ncbi:hypothetical protein OKW27_006070 [Paraburkholderia sp. 35.1]
MRDANAITPDAGLSAKLTAPAAVIRPNMRAHSALPRQLRCRRLRIEEEDRIISLRHTGRGREARSDSRNAPTGGLGANSLKRAIKLTTIPTGSTVAPPAIAAVPQSSLQKAYSNLRFGSTRNQIVIGAPAYYRLFSRNQNCASKPPIPRTHEAKDTMHAKCPANPPFDLGFSTVDQAAHKVPKPGCAAPLFQSQSVAPNPMPLRARLCVARCEIRGGECSCRGVDLEQTFCRVSWTK